MTFRTHIHSCAWLEGPGLNDRLEWKKVSKVNVLLEILLSNKVKITNLLKTNY